MRRAAGVHIMWHFLQLSYNCACLAIGKLLSSEVVELAETCIARVHVIHAVWLAGGSLLFNAMTYDP